MIHKVTQLKYYNKETTNDRKVPIKYEFLIVFIIKKYQQCSNDHDDSLLKYIRVGHYSIYSNTFSFKYSSM